MGQKIEYKTGDIIGECVYMNDEESYKSPNSRFKSRRAKFVCKCGNEFITNIYSVKAGLTRSCGCLFIEELKDRVTTHGMSGTSVYHTWCDIKDRCYNQNNVQYNDYGGRGIYMYSKWRNDFVKFLNYISRLHYFGEAGRTLDRIKNNDGYRPGNLRWATRNEQNTNQRIRKDNTTGFIGVSFDTRKGKFISRISIKKKEIPIGHFNTLKKAIDARNKYITENNLTQYKIQ